MMFLDPLPPQSSLDRPCLPGASTLLMILVALDMLALSLCAAMPPPLTWRWSNPLPHGANVYGMVQGLGLTVQVGERGQIYTSADLRVWEARTSPTRQSLRSAAFLHERILITGESGTVLYSDDFETYNLVSLNTEDWLEGVAASLNLAVAVGDFGAIYTSADGAQWHRQSSGHTTWLRGVAHGGGLFVAVGENGMVLTSPNGTNWTRRAVPTTAHLNGVAWLGNRFMILANGGYFLLSQNNGYTWTLDNAGTTNRLLGASGTPMRNLVYGVDELRLTSDADSWFDQTAFPLAFPAPSWTYLNALDGGDTYFVAGRSGMMIEGYQTNAVAPFDWFTLKPSIRNWLWEVQRLPDFYAAVGWKGTIMTSEDGRRWNLEFTPPDAQHDVLLGIGGDTNRLVVVGEKGRILLSPNVQANLVHTNSNGMLVTNRSSTLGIFWNVILPTPTSADLQGVTLWQDQFVVSGDLGTLLTSDDGTNWMSHPTPTEGILSGVAGFPHGVVAVGFNGTILHSPNAADWNVVPLSPPTAHWLYRVRWTGDRLVAVGEYGTVLSSTNGFTWTTHPTGQTNWLTDVTYLDGAFYISGVTGTILWSDDLIQFQNLEIPTKKAQFGLAHHGDQLITVGVEGSILRTSLTPNLKPVRIVKFDRVDNQNLFLLGGDPDQRIAIDGTVNFLDWSSSRVFEFLDNTGTLLILDEADEVEPEQEFFRVLTVP